MQRGLREYAEYVLARNEMSQYMRVVDPRTEEEKINASDLQTLAQANNELVNYEQGTVKFQCYDHLSDCREVVSET